MHVVTVWMHGDGVLLHRWHDRNCSVTRMNLLSHFARRVSSNASWERDGGNGSNGATLTCMLHIRCSMCGSGGRGRDAFIALLTRTHSLVLVHKLQTEDMLTILARTTSGGILILALGTVFLATFAGALDLFLLLSEDMRALGTFGDSSCDCILTGGTLLGTRHACRFLRKYRLDIRHRLLRSLRYRGRGCGGVGGWGWDGGGVGW